MKSYIAVVTGVGIATLALSGPASANPGQEQACASRMADEMNMPMSGVRVTSSNAFNMGSRQVKVTVAGMSAQCTADVHNHVVYFRYLGDR